MREVKVNIDTLNTDEKDNEISKLNREFVYYGNTWILEMFLRDEFPVFDICINIRTRGMRTLIELDNVIEDDKSKVIKKAFRDLNAAMKPYNLHFGLVNINK